jgi:hypothetical protein
MNPFDLPEGLADRLAALAERAHRESSRYRPEVVRYLFEEGWLPLHRAYAEQPDRDALLASLWALQLETITSGQFGVSTDAWRSDPAYPDRYFPRLWLDTLPKAAETLEPAELLEVAVALFNLGERLDPAIRAAANHVAERLAQAPTQLGGGGYARIVRTALERAGLLPGETVGPRRWTTARLLAWLHLGERERDFLVDALTLDDEGLLSVYDAGRGRVARATVGETGLDLLDLDDCQTIPDCGQAVRLDGEAGVSVEIRLGLTERGRRLLLDVTGQARDLGPVALVPCSMLTACSKGYAAVGGPLSQRVAVYRLEADELVADGGGP